MTFDQVAAAFAEWEREFREDPEAFQSAEEKSGDPLGTYGENAARTFLRYVDQVSDAS